MSSRRTPTGRAVPKERAKSEPCCGRCGFRTRLVPNPYYGAGLAVHRYLRVCRRCPWTVIVRENPLPAPSAPAEAPPHSTDDKTPARPVRRLGFRWSHREAS